MANNFEFRDSCMTGDSLRYTAAWYAVGAGGRGSPPGNAYDQNGGAMKYNVSAEDNKVAAQAWKMDGYAKPYYMSYVESGTQHVTIGCETATGKLIAYRGGYGGTVLARSTAVLFVNGDHPHVETKCKVHATTGSFDARVNGIAVTWDAANTNVNTKNGGTGVINAIWFGVSGDHGWICDINSQFGGSDWAGDVRVLCSAANGAGSDTDGVATGAGTLTQCVDEKFTNGDTDYILQDSTGLPKAATFAMEDAPSNVVAILDVAPVVLSRKDDAGIDNVRGLFKSGATTDDGGADVAALAAYSDIFGIGAGKRHYQTDPNTSAAWTIADFNAIEVGYRRTA